MNQTMLILAILVAPAVALAADAAPATRPATTAPAATPEISPQVQAFLKPAEAVAGDDALRQKLKERHNTAVRLLELRIAAYQKGIVDASSVFEAARLVADAKMDLAQNADERQDVIEQVIDVARVAEMRLEKQWQAGFGSAADLERARLVRQTAEVELLKLRRTAGAPTTQPR